MSKSILQLLNETAAEAVKAFPQEMGRLAVVMVSEADKSALAFAAPSVAKELTNDAIAFNQAAEGIAHRLAARGTVSYTHGNYDLAGTPVNLIALLDPAKIEGEFSARHTKEMQAVFILDRQIGLHVVSNSSSLSPNKAESAADAYAMLRHIQRFGKDTDQPAIHNQDTAANMILFADMPHYTADAIQQVREVANKMGDEFFTLPPHRIAEMAADIAETKHPGFRTLWKLKDAFEPVMQQVARLGDTADIFAKFARRDPEICEVMSRETLAVMQKNRHDYDIFTAGKRFLDNAVLKEFMTAKAAAGDNAWTEGVALANAPAPQTPDKRRHLSFIPRF